MNSAVLLHSLRFQPLQLEMVPTLAILILFYQTVYAVGTA